ncbi:MAG: LacI family DNA-binding transcriptional regulator [Verrucomicrobiales bacterium]
MSVTLKQVAAVSNVSVSTASRALSGHPGISGPTVDRIREAANQLNYKVRRPDAAGGSLKGAEIGIICLRMDRSLTSLPTVSAAIEGAETSLAKEGARTLFVTVPELESPPSVLTNRLPDGLILAGALQGDEIGRSRHPFLEQLRRLPTVWLLGRPAAAWGDVVGSNDYEVGAMAARALLEAGHKQLAFINPKPDHLLFRRREDGFRAEARRAGAETVLSICESPAGGWELPLQAPAGVRVVETLIDRAIAANPRPTGLFAAADSVAVLVYRALAKRGLKVGQDISIVSGNNDTSLIAGLHPSLTTCDVGAYEIGQLAVRQLAMRLRHGTELAEVEILTNPTLIRNASVAECR